MAFLQNRQRLYQVEQFLQRAPGVSQRYVKAYSDLIAGLVRDGIWSNLDALYIFVTDTEEHAKINLKSSSFGITETTTVNFTANAGSTNSNGYFDTGFTPSTANGRFALDACSIGTYQTNSYTTGETRAHIAGADATNSIGLYHKHGNGLTTVALNSGTYYTSGAQADNQGMFIATRPASNSFKCYKNGSEIITGTGSGAALVTQPLYIFANNNNGSAIHSLTSNYTLGAAFIGGALTPTDAANLTTRINTYMTVFGVNAF